MPGSPAIARTDNDTNTSKITGPYGTLLSSLLQRHVNFVAAIVFREYHREDSLLVACTTSRRYLALCASERDLHVLQRVVEIEAEQGRVLADHDSRKYVQHVIVGFRRDCVIV